MGVRARARVRLLPPPLDLGVMISAELSASSRWDAAEIAAPLAWLRLEVGVGVGLRLG